MFIPFCKVTPESLVHTSTAHDTEHDIIITSAPVKFLASRQQTSNAPVAIVALAYDDVVGVSTQIVTISDDFQQHV